MNPAQQRTPSEAASHYIKGTTTRLARLVLLSRFTQM
jgi:hypothetical protein